MADCKHEIPASYGENPKWFECAKCGLTLKNEEHQVRLPVVRLTFGNGLLTLLGGDWIEIRDDEVVVGRDRPNDCLPVECMVEGLEDIIRRVAPLPKCETCSNSTVDPKMVQQFSSDCDLAPGQPDERVCLVWEAFVPHDGYCHLHPQAQEVTR